VLFFVSVGMLFDPSAVRGITLESLEIQTDGEIDLHGFPSSPS
jgi:hypothetical protein